MKRNGEIQNGEDPKSCDCLFKWLKTELGSSPVVLQPERIQLVVSKGILVISHDVKLPKYPYV
jgi:hypothetical protein